MLSIAMLFGSVYQFAQRTPKWDRVRVLQNVIQGNALFEKCASKWDRVRALQHNEPR
jgi:hypothetical protein